MNTDQSIRHREEGELSEYFIELSHKLVKRLTDDRKSGAVTPEHPKTADAYCAEHNRMYPNRPKVTDAAFRDMVSYQRTNHHILIGSVTRGKLRGYFLALNGDELRGTIDHMESRIRKQSAALRGLEAGIREREASQLKLL